MKLENSRRDFIKTSALVTGGLMTSPFVLPGAYAAPANELKLALIGCGGRGTGAAFQAMETGHNIKLVAMADAFRDRLDNSYNALVGKYGAEKIAVSEDMKLTGFDAYKQAIAEADVVILATPPGFRPIHFEEAVKQGKQVFMEKPVAVDAAGIRKVLAAAEEAKAKKLNVVVGLQRHYQANYIETIDRIHNGDIGEIINGQVYWNDGGVWVRERQPGQTEMEYQMRNWYYFNWLCGDHINEQHVHNIDIANWVKQGYPVKAEGTGGRLVRTGKENGEIFDHHVLTFTYEDGSVIHSECRHFPGAQNRVDESFQGTKGTAYLSAGNHGVLKDWKGNVLYEHDRKNQPNPYQVEHDKLWAALFNGEYKFADAENAAKSTMTAIMGRYATYSGKPLTWDEALNGQVDLMPETFAWDAMPKVLPGDDGYYPHAVPGKTKVI
ncbi:Gfo/Idh/MocA family oxidoreductase [Algoriphagus halophytocola]|uniref:Gfo/Idh/MocA family oxidoreductase n=1 Tax=Algoriphagus halophytocola TaxID=2991499 RepID=A0ABY6MCE2_9BACT|nr:MULTISPECIES: Gfo/Idh/MocA family oxidoreductase [unclassified Algoriphagus]UZD21315.1 Gfo/Idh/MocA family oxidoreductase [Algoriphagus sp. TR-M5]WBL42526.1 Gfo/Idh/MocA family oxidoreductase [Algoriphagus sp. TR-M9]